ncbi:hypothetical protein KCU65_g9517, partial [Aureobasidium melanogenum]
MADSVPLDPGTEPVAAESEPSIAQMIQAIRDQYTEIQRIGNSINLLLEAWYHAVFRLKALKHRLETWHPAELDAENVDLDHVARLTRVVQADKYEGDLLSAIQRRLRRLGGMIDELEGMAGKLKIKALAYGDGGARDFAQWAGDKMQEGRRETESVAEQIIEQREEIMDGPVYQSSFLFHHKISSNSNTRTFSKSLEKHALDAYHAILKIMRADRAIFDEIEEASHKALLLADKMPYGELFATMAQVTLDNIQKERQHMEWFLMRFPNYPG